MRYQRQSSFGLILNARRATVTRSRPRARWAVRLVLCTSLLVSACSDDDAQSTDNSGRSQSNSQGGESAADGTDRIPDEEQNVEAGQDDTGSELRFGDPADSGFDAVNDPEPKPEPTPATEAEELSEPEELLPKITQQLDNRIEGVEVLDSVDILDVVAPSQPPGADQRDGRTRNSSGTLALLDQSASLACADVEISLDRVDSEDNFGAVERVLSAAERAGNSDIRAVRVWQEHLSAVVADDTVSDLAPLIGFLTICLEGGYEL